MNAELSFGDWLRQQRRALDLTQEELARQVGCSAITLRKLEAEERRPSKQIAERLADALHVPPDDRPAFLRFSRGDPFAAGSSIAALADSPIGQTPAIAVPTLTQPPKPFTPRPAPAETDEVPAPGESPFQGLRFFDEADAERFFGREALVGRLVARLAALSVSRQTRRILAVVGASGSGKSSVVRAGVLPTLRRNDAAGRFVKIHVITPTAHPLEALASSLTQTVDSVVATATLMDDLARDARSLHLYAQRLLRADDGHGAEGRLLLAVDQFEEVFTLCRAEAERQAFIDNLLWAIAPEAAGPVTLVLTLRADFYAHCAPYAELRDALAEQQEYIGPMSPAELRQAIEQPAQRGGWAFEPGLVDQILRDVGAGDGHQPEPGALPLLSQALLETWRHRRGRTLRLHSYAEAGRVQGAIATSAEAVLQSLAPDEQAIARNIFVRLTELGEGTQDTRRRVALAELLPPGGDDAVGQVLKTLSDARLITQDQAAVEVAHEALIREWPTLRQWLSENREGLRLHRRLTEAAQEWDALNREPSELYRGPRLAQAMEWAEWAPHRLELNALELEFLQASQSLAEQEAREREAQRQRELEAAQQLAQTAQKLAQTEQAQVETERQAAARLRLRNRIITAVGGLAAIIALWAALLASRNGSLAASNAASANAAQAAARAASARELALSAINNLSVDPQLGLLLALQSVRLTYSVDKTVLPEAAGALHGAVSASHLLLSLPVSVNGGVVRVAFSVDGQRLATLSDDGTVTVWDLSRGAPAGQQRSVYSFPGHVANSTDIGWQALTFSPDGTRLAAAGNDNVWKIWDTVSGKELLSVSEGFFVRALAFSPDGRRIAVGGYQFPVELRDTATGQLVGAASEQGSIEGLAYSPDGARLAVASQNQAQIREVATGRVLQTLAPPSSSYATITFSPDGNRLATADYDGEVRVWDAATGQQLFHVQADSTCCIAFSPDGKRLATGGVDGVARIWDAATGQELFSRLGHTKLIFGVAFSADGTRLATASADGTAGVWDTNADRELVTLSDSASPVYSVTFSPDGTRMVTGGLDKRARLWDAATGQELAGPAGRLDVIRALDFSPDGQRIATASDFSPPKVWDAATGQLLFTLYGHNLGGWAIAYSPDGTRLATGSINGSTSIWDAATGKETLILPGPSLQDARILFIGGPWTNLHYQKVAALAFSRDGTRIVASSVSKTAQVWDTATGQELLNLAGHSDLIESVAYSPDGQRIATASLDGTGKVWDAHTGQALFTLSGHTTGVTSIAYSPDGAWIASGSLDSTAKLWEAATGRLLQNLPGPTGPVTSVAFSPDGTRLAAASLDGTTRLYVLKMDDLLTLAKTRVTRSLRPDECQQYLHGPCPEN